MLFNVTTVFDPEIIHGDIKGANILITDRLEACLCDFGLSRFATENTLWRTTATHAGGTLRWMAPELITEDVCTPTTSSDIYAYGMTCYEIITGTVPFAQVRNEVAVANKITRGERPDRVEFYFSDEIWSIITSCWSQDVESRPTAGDVLALIQATPVRRDGDEGMDLACSALSELGMTAKIGQDSEIALVVAPHDNDLGYAHKGRYEHNALDEEGRRDWGKKTERASSDSKTINATGLGAHTPLRSSSIPLSTMTPRIRGNTRSPFPDEPDVHSERPELRRGGYVEFNTKVRPMLSIQLVHNLVHESAVRCVRFSPDGKYLATGCNRTAQIYDTTTGARIRFLVHWEAREAGDMYIRSVCFSPDGTLLATGAEDKQIRIWDISRKRILHVFGGHQQKIHSLDFSPDGRFIVSGSSDKTARIWDMANADASPKVLTAGDLGWLDSDAGITSVAFSPDGQFVAASSLDTTVYIWDVATSHLVERLQGHTDSVSSIAFTPDGKGLVSGSLHKALKFWDISGLVMAGSSTDGNATMSGMKTEGGSTASPGGMTTHGAVVKRDGGETSPCTMTITGHKGDVLSVAVSHDGQWAVSGSKDSSIQFWDAKSAAAHCELLGHKSSVISVNLSPNGGLLAAGGEDWQATIWRYYPRRGSINHLSR